MNHILTFDEESHIYWVNGGRIPSVTHIINEFFPFEGQGLAADRGRDFGKAVHMAISLEVKGLLNPATVDPALQPYLNQFWSFLCAYNILTTQCKTEVILYSKKHNFAGTIDLVENLIVEIKTGAVESKHKLQLVAYENLWNENNPKNKIKNSVLIYLDGSDNAPKIVGYNPEDWGCFLSLLNIHNWKRKENLK